MPSRASPHGVYCKASHCALHLETKMESPEISPSRPEYSNESINAWLLK